MKPKRKHRVKDGFHTTALSLGAFFSRTQIDFHLTVFSLEILKDTRDTKILKNHGYPRK